MFLLQSGKSISLTSQRSLISLELRPPLIPLEYRGEVVKEWLPGFRAQQDVVADVVQRVAARLHLALQRERQAAVAGPAREQPLG